MAKFIADGACELYYDNSKKLETYANGVKVSTSGETHLFLEGDAAGDAGVYLYLKNANTADDSFSAIQGNDASRAATSEIKFMNQDDSTNKGYLQFSARPASGSLTTIMRIQDDKINCFKDVKPDTNGSIDLGASGAKWADIYGNNEHIITSDRNEKNNITASDLGLAFINKLTPVSYKWKTGTRTHYGLVAQDVETVITDLGKSTTQFAALIKTDISEKQDGSNISYGLRTGEFISPLIKAVQELSAKVAALEAA